MSRELKGNVLRIERSSIHDGQGLRCVVFLKGCPLACKWCSTPESQKPGLEKVHLAERCVGCGTCVSQCPSNALSFTGDKLVRDNDLCTECFSCIAVCPQEAHRGYGQLMSVAQVVHEICKDEIFFYHSGGGVTLSGGECLLQADFSASVLHECSLRGIHTAVETSLYSSWKNIEKILPAVNTLFVDVKHPVSAEHKKLTGVGNELILENLLRLDRLHLAFELQLRIPLVPGINDSEESLRAFLTLARQLKKLKQIEILPYHRLGVGTYAILNKNYELGEIPAPSSDYITQCAQFLQNQQPGVPIKIGGGYI